MGVIFTPTERPMPKLFGPDVDDLPHDPAELRSRTDDRRERIEAEERLMQLARTLADLGDRSLVRLELSEQLRDAVVRARAIPSAPARKRALRAVRNILRDGDPEHVQRQVTNLTRPRPVHQAQLEHWRERLITGGDAELGAFIEAHPDADRRRLRQLARNAAGADEASRAASLRALSQALRQYLG
jgi:ribosome-associated protein